MELQGYGIRLKKLTAADIEMVRGWRNSPQVRDYMEYRDYITPQMQKNWFASLHPEQDLYFIFYSKEVPMGIVNAKHIHLRNGSAETGAFTAGPEIMGSAEPALAVLLLMEYLFEVLDLRTLRAKVNTHSPAAMKLNLSLGYRPIEKVNPAGFQYFEIQRDDFMEATERIRLWGRKLGRDWNS